MTTPFNCSNCGAPCDCDYICPGCREPICDRCIHLGHEMEYVLGKYRCAKCAKEDKMAEMPKVIITVEDMTLRQAYKLAVLYGLIAHSGWAKDARMDFHRYIAEQAGSIADAMLAEDAEREGEDG
jgi:hypothetical protein